MLDDLRELARLYGVETSYHNAMGRYVEASPESLLAVLRALGASLESADDTAEALDERRRELAERVIEPVFVAWDGKAPEMLLRFASDSGRITCRFDLEDGERWAWEKEISSLPPASPTGRLLVLPHDLPTGYHHLRVEHEGRSGEALVISAPTRAFAGDGKPLWGVFLPLYALQTRESWGAGDFSDLERLAEWTAGLGGGVVATLPMLAQFLDEPFEPSPYGPASRLFWNELFLDPRRVPELETCAEAKRLLAELRKEIEELRKAPLVDYARLMALKRRVLEELARQFFAEPSPDRRDAYEAFAESRPELETYAAFRAVGERRGEPWQNWPERLRERTLAPADWD
jgi:4-alpha-glucanotransferase